MSRRPILPLLALVSCVALQGCAVLALPGAGAAVAAANAGAGAIKAGTEFGATGVAYRTFSVPIDNLHEIVLTSLGRLELELERDAITEDEKIVILARATSRSVELTLEPLTGTLTSLRLVVKRGPLARDRATASEIIAETERNVDAAAALPRASNGAGCCCSCNGR